MRGVLRALLLLQLLLPVCASAADEKVAIELNSIETVDNHCRLNFVIENKSDVAIESFKLDVVVFGVDGGILRRLLMEMGPVRPAKTIVRTFPVDGECNQIGSILVNDVAACVPGEPGACLDGLALSSRLKTLRFYK
ncbi:MAG TPA: hypothetical protein VH934_19740 [Xanthobacteraceae bacterium]|jgi:hypothetical protein